MSDFASLLNIKLESKSEMWTHCNKRPTTPLSKYVVKADKRQTHFHYAAAQVYVQQAVGGVHGPSTVYSTEKRHVYLRPASLSYSANFIFIYFFTYTAPCFSYNPGIVFIFPFCLFVTFFKLCQICN